MDDYIKTISFIAVILLVGGVLVMYGMSLVLNDSDAKYRVDRDYEVSGMFEGETISGNGHTHYLSEPSSFIYQVTATYTYESGGSSHTGECPTFSVIADTNKQLVSSLYTDMGIKIVHGKECREWKYEGDGFTALFSIDEMLCIHEFCVTTVTLDLHADLLSI